MYKRPEEWVFNYMPSAGDRISATNIRSLFQRKQKYQECIHHSKIKNTKHDGLEKVSRHLLSNLANYVKDSGGRVYVTTDPYGESSSLLLDLSQQTE